MDLEKTSYSSQKTLVYVVCGVLLFLYLFLQYYFISPIPFGDDLPSIYRFLLHLEHTNSFSEKLKLIVTNGFVEHKLLFSNLFVTSLYALIGKISLPLFALGAGLVWCSIFFFYKYWLQSIPVAQYWLIAITLVLVSFAPYQAIFWTMAALQHFSVTFLCFLTIYFLCKPSRQNLRFFLLATFSGFICTFSSGNGMAVWPAGFLALLLRREIKFTLGWILSSVAGIGSYLYSIALNETPSGSKLSHVFEALFVKIINFIAGLAGASHFKNEFLDFSDGEFPITLTYFSIYLGLLLLLLFSLALIEAYRNKNRGLIAIISVSAFIVITFAFVAFGRSSSQELFVVFKSRYYTYSVIAIANGLFCLAYLTRQLRYQKAILYVSLAYSTFFWGCWHFNSYTNLLNQRNILDLGYLNFTKTGQWICYQPTFFYERFYNTFFSENQDTLVQLPSTDLHTAFRNKRVTDVGFFPCSNVGMDLVPKVGFVNVRLYNGEAPAIFNRKEGYAIAMVSKRDTFLLYTTLLRNSVKKFLTTGQLTRKGYNLDSHIRRENFPKGSYELHQFYFRGKEGFYNPKNEGTITL
ncbi:hypothetical protein C5O19_05915 [Siphonobacter curvatus]|uniref:Glycosyltransferase RgtA/B/C/D-like domain-containing protein n=2 Tax=Siphonobacter curvatus TaxID=2094562 RepID=A0A2S7IN81_9BACT|nr:hypothetical protein C5O19_05915 [Siphonobacter curvatus]